MYIYRYPNILLSMIRKYIKLASLFFKSLLFSISYVLFYTIITSCIMYKLDGHNFSLWKKISDMALEGRYRKFAIDRPGGKQFLAIHNFWITHFRTII